MQGGGGEGELAVKRKEAGGATPRAQGGGACGWRSPPPSLGLWRTTPSRRPCPQRGRHLLTGLCLVLGQRGPSEGRRGLCRNSAQSQSWNLGLRTSRPPWRAFSNDRFSNFMRTCSFRQVHQPGCGASVGIPPCSYSYSADPPEKPAPVPPPQPLFHGQAQALPSRPATPQFLRVRQVEDRVGLAPTTPGSPGPGPCLESRLPGGLLHGLCQRVHGASTRPLPSGKVSPTQKG